MKSRSLLALVGLTLAAAPALANEELAKKHACTACHAVDKKVVGPAFKDVAAKYKGKADAEATLTAKLSAAKGHPAVKASADDLKSIVKWILSL